MIFFLKKKKKTKKINRRKKKKKKLLREIGDKIQLGDRFYPLKDVSVDPLVQLLITQQT